MSEPFEVIAIDLVGPIQSWKGRLHSLTNCYLYGNQMA